MYIIIQSIYLHLNHTVQVIQIKCLLITFWDEHNILSFVIKPRDKNTDATFEKR